MKSNIFIRPFWEEDLQNGFLDVIKVLSKKNDFEYAYDKVISVCKDINNIRLYSTIIKTFVAVDFPKNKVIGTSTLLIEPKFIHQGSVVGHIEDVAVLPDYQGAGVGNELVKRCVDEAKVCGCYKVILDCDVNVKGFYERAGFYQKEIQMRYDL